MICILLEFYIRLGQLEAASFGLRDLLRPDQVGNFYILQGCFHKFFYILQGLYSRRDLTGLLASFPGLPDLAEDPFFGNN